MTIITGTVHKGLSTLMLTSR